MTLPASGQLTVKEIFEEIFPITHSTEFLRLETLYGFSGLTPKSTDIAISDFHNYTRILDIFLTETAITIPFPANGFIEVAKLFANAPWSVTITPAWVTVDSSTSGSFAYDIAFSFTVTENIGLDDRIGTVRFKLDSSAEFVDFVITQEKNPLP